MERHDMLCDKVLPDVVLKCVLSQLARIGQFMGKLSWSLGGALVGVVLAGCMPSPHYEYYVPAIRGVVMRDGRPLSGVRVSVSSAVAEGVQAVHTSPDGHFSTGAVRVMRLLERKSSDVQMKQFAVHLEVEGRQYSGFWTVAQNAPEALGLRCDLSHPVEAFGLRQYCVATSTV